jgi:hypothetical protein
MIAYAEERPTSFALAVMLAAAAAVLLMMVPLRDAGLALAAAAALVLVVLNRHAALYVVAMAIALSPESNVGVTFRIEDLLMVLLVLTWVPHLLTFRDRQRTPLDRILIAYVLAGFVGTLWGLHLGTAHITLDKDYSAPFHLLKRIEFVLLFFIVVDTLKTVRDVQRFTYVFMAALFGLNLYSLIVYLSGSPIALGPAGAPIHEPGLASMLNVALAISLLPGASKPARVLLGALIAFSLAVLPLALGRNFISSTVLILLYVGLFQQRWVLACIPLPFLMWFAYPQRFVRRILTLENVFAPDYTGMQTQGAALVSRAVAKGHYTFLTLGYSPVFGFGMATQPLGAMDSEYVTQLLYTGLVGLVVFLIFGARLFRLISEAKRAAKDPAHLALANAFQLILVAYAVYSVFSPSISAQRAGGLFFLIVGLIAVLHRALTQQAQAGSSSEAAPAPVAAPAARWARGAAR